MYFSIYVLFYIRSCKTIKDPAASNGVSNLQRCQAAEDLTLAAVTKCPIQHFVGFKHAIWLVARGNKRLKGGGR